MADLEHALREQLFGQYLRHDTCKAGCLLLAGVLLILYSVAMWIITYRLTRPIQTIVDAILPFQEGKEPYLPKVEISFLARGDEIDNLAHTLNALTEKISKQLEHLTEQKRWTEGILDSLGEGVVALNTEARTTFANPTACKWLGFSNEELL